MFGLLSVSARCCSLQFSAVKASRIAKRFFVCARQKCDVEHFYTSRSRSRANCCQHLTRRMATLETLQFDNLALRTLPIDPVKVNFVRQVNNSCFSLVEPSPVNNPQLVIYSEPALSLLELGQDEIERREFTDYFSGNKKLPGCETASHCYCGHQFGTFAGQLGDGAAIYLGEVINRHGERWEMQLKGAGRTPYSRTADGRKVLRSSIREFLCSEAMHHLGIPTTRAGSCITSDTKVVRDIFYDGNPIYERATIVLRMAPSFIRFGSFEIFKEPDLLTGRRGPSAGKKDILIQLIEYVIKTFYPNIYETHKDNSEERYITFFKEVVLRTARMVSEWQCVGFCHGVLNTDNMSILGLTIDYGPFGFMDNFNSGYVCNDSDDMARYSYKAQPGICKWNLFKLAEALNDVLPIEKSKELLEEVYDKEFMQCYISKMRKKLGIIHKEDPNDKELIESLLRTMEATGADFTNVFRCLSRIKITETSEFEKCNESVLEYILSQCTDSSDMPSSSPMSGQMQLLVSMMNSNPALAAQLEGNPLFRAERERMESAKKLQSTSPEEKHTRDKEAWRQWMETYRKRIMEEFEGSPGDTHSSNEARVDLMNNNNPRFILRNYIAESAIKAAEKDDYSLVKQVLAVLQKPYSNDPVEDYTKDEASSNSDIDIDTPDPDYCSFENKPPKWGLQLRVT